VPDLKTLIDRTFALLFAAILAAPLLQWATRLVPEFPVDEQRAAKKIAAPWSRLVAMDPRLADDLNAWFDDRFGFRGLLIRIKNEIDYQAFGSSDTVLIGREGWLFDKDFFNDVIKDSADPALQQKILDTLRSLRDCLAQRGVKLVFVLDPTKSSLYPQFLPAEAPASTDRLSRRLADALGREPGLLFIDGEPILSAHTDEALFYKTDVHMNLKGGAYVYREVVARVARMMGQPAPRFAPEAWNPVPYVSGTERRFLAKLLPVDDTFYATPSIYTYLADDALGTFEINIGESDLPDRSLPLFDQIFRNKRPPATLLPAMMIFGTSFVDNLFALKYHEAFATVYLTRSNSTERIDPVLRHLPAEVKIFVLEFPEPWLGRILQLGRSLTADASTCRATR
jgi:hypothetical protein